MAAQGIVRSQIGIAQQVVEPHELKADDAVANRLGNQKMAELRLQAQKGALQFANLTREEVIRDAQNTFMDTELRLLELRNLRIDITMSMHKKQDKLNGNDLDYQLEARRELVDRIAHQKKQLESLDEREVQLKQTLAAAEAVCTRYGVNPRPNQNVAKHQLNVPVPKKPAARPAAPVGAQAKPLPPPQAQPQAMGANVNKLLAGLDKGISNLEQKLIGRQISALDKAKAAQSYAQLLQQLGGLKQKQILARKGQGSPEHQAIDAQILSMDQRLKALFNNHLAPRAK